MSKKILFTILLFSLPTFGLMLRSGIYTMHDFHAFRQYEFNKCLINGIFPCRWSPDSAWGYGEPVFNYYGQFPYLIGQLFIAVGSQVIDAVKILFILSLVLSGLSMYLLARRFWTPSGALISSILYMYAPYRAVDVWVRGALPECLAFVLYPLSFYFLDRLIESGQKKFTLTFSMCLSSLIITHNLSMYMALPFLCIWWLFRSTYFHHLLKSTGSLILSGILALGLSAFYLLPVIFENQLVTLFQTTQGYYNYAIHFVTLSQLFISRLWGYDGSTWGPNDNLSFSLGHAHWILLLLCLILLLYRRFTHTLTFKNFLFFFGLALFSIFLTHGKSEILWKLLPGMRFIQFPWRFLTQATLFISLGCGVITQLLPKKLIWLIPLVVVLTNFSFFRPDIWRSVNDAQQFSGPLWTEQIASALQDYWPSNALSQPNSPAPSAPIIISGEGLTQTLVKSAQSASYSLDIFSPQAQVQFPIVYFPGWQGTSDNQPLNLHPRGSLGVITAELPSGHHNISLGFTNTPIRTWGNIISLFFLLLLTILWTGEFPLFKNISRIKS